MSPAALGLYAAASRVQLLGAVIIQAATRIVHPRFFAAAAAGEAELGALTRRAAAQMAFVGGAGMMLVALAAQILPLVLGESFAGAGALGTLLSAAVPCLALQYPAADALTARNRQGLRTVLHLVAAAACVGLVALGAVLAGIPGAAHGYVAGQALLAAMLWGALGLVSRRTA
jgi:O-antigen/teichoic acid export membrane protein